MLHISENPAERLLIREGRLFDTGEKQISKLAKHAKKKIAFVTNLSQKAACSWIG